MINQRRFFIHPEQTLGIGSWGTIFRGLDQLTGQPLAVKVLLRQKASNIQSPTSLEFDPMNEIDILQQLSGIVPGVVPLLHFEQDDNNDYLFMELGPKNLLDFITTDMMGSPLPEDLAKDIFAKVLLIIRQIHERAKIIHRDLKLENILYEQTTGQVGIIDFGMATKVNSSQEVIVSRRVGSPGYIAPEILRRFPYQGAAADIYSLGVILYLMVCTKFPFKDRENLDFYRFDETVVPFGDSFQEDKNTIRKNLEFPKHTSFGGLPLKLELTDQLKHLLGRMLQTNCNERATWEEIFDHPWIRGTISSIMLKEVQAKQQVRRSTLYSKLTSNPTPQNNSSSSSSSSSNVSSHPTIESPDRNKSPLKRTFSERNSKRMSMLLPNNNHHMLPNGKKDNAFDFFKKAVNFQLRKSGPTKDSS